MSSNTTNNIDYDSIYNSIFVEFEKTGIQKNGKTVWPGLDNLLSIMDQKIPPLNKGAGIKGAILSTVSDKVKESIRKSNPGYFGSQISANELSSVKTAINGIIPKIHESVYAGVHTNLKSKILSSLRGFENIDDSSLSDKISAAINSGKGESEIIEEVCKEITKEKIAGTIENVKKSSLKESLDLTRIGVKVNGLLTGKFPNVKITNVVLHSSMYNDPLSGTQIGIPSCKISILISDPKYTITELGLSLFKTFIIEISEYVVGQIHQLCPFSIINIEQSIEGGSSSIDVYGVHPWFFFQKIGSKAYRSTNTVSNIIEDVINNSSPQSQLSKKDNYYASSKEDTTNTIRNLETDIDFISRIIQTSLIEEAPALFYIDLYNHAHLTSYTDLSSGSIKPKVFLSQNAFLSSEDMSSELSESLNLVEKFSLESSEFQSLKDLDKPSSILPNIVCNSIKISIGNNKWKKSKVVYSIDSGFGTVKQSWFQTPIKDNSSNSQKMAFPFDAVNYLFLEQTDSIICPGGSVGKETYFNDGIKNLRFFESLIKIDLSSNKANIPLLYSAGEKALWHQGNNTSGLNGIYIISNVSYTLNLLKEVTDDFYSADISTNISISRPFLDFSFGGIKGAYASM